MLPITLEKLLNSSEIQFSDTGFVVTLQPEWVVAKENRLSYITALKLAECCREYHWTKDLLSESSLFLDSTIRNLTAEFKAPLFIGDKVHVSYFVSHIGIKSYTLQIELERIDELTPASIFTLINVFLDSYGKSIDIAPTTRSYLNKLRSKHPPKRG
jgi:acyl-CoA thioesterase FadM